MSSETEDLLRDIREEHLRVREALDRAEKSLRESNGVVERIDSDIDKHSRAAETARRNLRRAGLLRA